MARLASKIFQGRVSKPWKSISQRMKWSSYLTEIR